ncbi:hypothetical protein JQ596_01770 [Bradyrhizobium manausense]|uniref:hypothetical protein n=1 Tax=Bradyrhizobium TaxID=374 RepID=UPI001BA6E060|nr:MULTISPECIES: hypothetical protein [Bradyrhizobium]MBR0824247.1 hypothetical protein [Bradyrhizobium manausense]UVO26648.1 hypothetical protein KUF59_29375 [Bradyrhizobium arachidis]
MRWVYLAIIIVFAVAIVVFAMQNLETVTMSFFRVNISMPLAVQTIIVYLLGAVTGGSLFALLRRSYEGTKRSLA